LVKVTNKHDDETRYFYDGFGNRIKTIVGLDHPGGGNRPDKPGNGNGNAYGHDKENPGNSGNPHPGWGHQNKRDYMEQNFVVDITSQYNDVLMMYGDHYEIQRYTYGLDRISMDMWMLEDEDNGWIPNERETNLSDNPERLYYLQDELGSTIRVIGEDGKTSAHYNYDEFGRPLSFKKFDQNWPGPDNTFGYTGYQYDVSSELYYAQARYYMPEIGRFISEDPWNGDLYQPNTLNPYPYVLNNPLKYVDPLGLKAEKSWNGCSGFGYLSGSTSLQDSYFNTISFEKDMLPNGNKYKKTVENNRIIIAEYNHSGKIINRWMLAGQVGTKVKGGHGDQIYVKLNKNTFSATRSGKVYSKEWYSYDLPMKKDVVVDAVKISDSFLSNENNFMYFDKSKNKFISNSEWRDNIHYKERVTLNSDYTLPLTPKDAKKEGFVELPSHKAIYHGSLEGNLKYVHADGREAIYKANYIYVEKQIKAVKVVSKVLKGYSRMTLKDNPDYGPTYNYINASESEAGHYLFDMLTYYWWQSTPEQYSK
ncbi:RHS repeat-associated core domain-containing protein, partial [Tepidibacter mesophilus]|uniref:RHS repeat-associated core domain-containing protein n=1 Tax=Tepidibacter mesophilus TaxID=655607 RepID=UPI0011AF6518